MCLPYFFLFFNIKTQEWTPEEKSLVVGRYVVKKKTSGIVTKNKRMSTTRIGIKVFHFGFFLQMKTFLLLLR